MCSNLIKSIMIISMLCTAAQAQELYEAPKFVRIGRANNPDDANAKGSCGAVGYEYLISKYAVRVSDWAKFYNTAGSGKVGTFNALYNTWQSASGTNAPAGYISFRQAAQYCNWLTTGSAISGAYSIDASGTVTAIDRNFRNEAGIVYVIPTRNEWYKAAFYKPDGSGYSDYSNGSNTAPPQSTNGATGFWYTQTTPWAVNLGTAEQNGTYNMMGCMWEFVEDLGGTCLGRGIPPVDFVLTSPTGIDEGKYYGFRLVVLVGSPAHPADNLPSTVYVYHENNNSADTSIDEMMSSVAGLANRCFPGEMLPESRTDWLDRLRQEYPQVRKDTSHSADWAWFIARYKSVFSGYILYDKAVSTNSLNVATSIAGITNAIIVDPSTVPYATNAGLTMIMDVRNQTQDWAWTNFPGRFNKQKIFHMSRSSEPLIGFQLRDYAIMQGGFAYCLTNDIGRYLGDQDTAGLLFGFGPENLFFTAGSQNDQQCAVGDLLNGASATIGWKTPVRPQTVHTALDALPATNKHYVAFVVSDGDNIAYLNRTFPNNDKFFKSPYRGQFKITWDMSPAYGEVNPSGVNYFYRLAGMDKFVCSGGHGLYYPAYVSNRGTLAENTAKSMRAVDQNVISILDQKESGLFGTYKMSNSVELVNQPQIIGAMYKTYGSAYAGLSGQIYWSSSGKPIVSVKYTLWDGYGTPSSIASALNSASIDPYNDSSSYSIVNVHPWSTNYAPLEGVSIIVSNLNASVEVVTLEELIIYLRNGYGASHGYRPVRQMYYWDRNGASSGAGASPSGTWGSDSAWNSAADGTGSVSFWPANSVAIFSAGSDATGSYTVTVVNTQEVAGLEFDEGSVTLSGGAIDITGNTIVLVAAGTHDIGSTLQGVGNLIKTGSGTLILSGINNHFTGSLTVQEGTVRITGNLTNKSDTVVQDGATLENTGYIRGNITVESGGTYTGSGTLTGQMVNNGIMRITDGDSFNVAGLTINNGLVDIMTGSSVLPGNLINNGITLDSSDIRIRKVEFSDNSLNLEINGYTGHSYQLQRAVTLFSPWMNVGDTQNGFTQSNGNPTFLNFTDPDIQPKTGFYRINVSP